MQEESEGSSIECTELATFKNKSYYYLVKYISTNDVITQMSRGGISLK